MTTSKSHKRYSLWVYAMAGMFLCIGLTFRVTSLHRTLFLPKMSNTHAQNKVELYAFVFDSPYDVQDMQAPAASGILLTFITRVIVSYPLGDWIVRYLMQKNGVPTLIELALAIQQTVAQEERTSGGEWGLSDPHVALSTDEYQWHEEAASTTKSSLYQPTAVSCNHTTTNSNNQAKAKTKQYRSLQEFHNAYQSGTTTPVKVLTKLLAFIHLTDSELRCIQELDIHGATTAAVESTARWARGEPLGIWDGIPILIKPEEEVVVGLKTTFGRQLHAMSEETVVAKQNGFIANRFIEQGAIIVGSTVMHEMGVQPTGFNSWYKGPYNPFDVRRFPGGSSSGSAVAVATGMVPLAIGWDGGGSIRIPAAWSGTVGLAATYGRIPYGRPNGLFGVPNMASVVKAGPLTNCVHDAGEALLLLGKPMTTQEGKFQHPYYVSHGGKGPPPPHLVPRWTREQNETKKTSIRVGVFPEWASHRPSGRFARHTLKDDAVYSAYERALMALTKGPLNAEIVNFTMPHMHRQALTHGILISTIFSFMWAGEAFDGGFSSLDTKGTHDDLQPATYIQLQIGRQVSGMEYLACLRIRAFALSRWRALFLQSPNLDVIVTPTVPMTATLRPSGSDSVGFSDSALMVQLMRYIWPANLVGLPSLAVPAGVDSDGMPVSLQVICLHWHEADCLSVGHEIEQMFKKERPIPPIHLFLDLLA